MSELIPQSPSPLCWAAPLGSCSEETGREHIVSESTLPGSQINLRGFPFLQGRTLTLDKKHFKINILCKRHNNALSKVDAAGTVSFNRLRDAAKPDLGPYTINGTLFERWLLKTLINMEVVADFKVKPRRDIVEIAFGQRTFEPNAGLFFLREGSDLQLGDERVSYTRLTEDGRNDKIIGGRFTVRNFELLLTLGPNPFSELQIIGPFAASQK